MSITRRGFNQAMVFAGLATVAGSSLDGQQLTAMATPRPQQTTGTFALLSDPMLMAPKRRSVSVVWFTDEPSTTNVVLVGHGVDALRPADVLGLLRGRYMPGVRVIRACTSVLSRTAEDADSNLPAERKPATLTRRPVRRHEGIVMGLTPGRRAKYRVASVHRGLVALSATYTLSPAPREGASVRLMLTSDHQDKTNTPRNLELAAKTMGSLDAVIMAGDLVNVPDRASEWFDTQSGSGYFPGLQGRASRKDIAGNVSEGAAIIQNVPLWPAIGNHEVMGRRDGRTSLNTIFANPVPREVAIRELRRSKNRLHGRAARQWVEDNSFSTRTYEEIYASLPASRTGGVRYYATTIGDVRLITLYVTRIWRNGEATADAAKRGSSRYHEATETIDKPLERGYGDFIFEGIGIGSQQYAWLAGELASRARKACRYTVVQLHEGPHGLGDNMMPHFGDPVEVIEKDSAGKVVGIRYEYPRESNVLLNDLCPLLEKSGVQLVLNGHSHLWNRFVAKNGRTHYLEASNTGNTYGAYHETSGMKRPVPSAPWASENYLAQDDPGKLQPVRPTRGGVKPEHVFVASNDHVVFQCFDSRTGTITSWIHDVHDPAAAPRVLDEFTLVPSR